MEEKKWDPLTYMCVSRDTLVSIFFVRYETTFHPIIIIVLKEVLPTLVLFKCCLQLGQDPLSMRIGSPQIVSACADQSVNSP